MRRLVTALSLLSVTILGVTPVLAAHIVTVWSGDMDGWAFRTSDDGTPPNTATATFVAGPATPPLGAGSAQFSVGANGASGAEIRNADYAGTALANLTALSYWTYISVEGSGGQAPYIILSVDLNDDGAWDDLLFFEPAYQDGSYAGDPVPDQGDVTALTWQQWDAAAGGWWSLNASTFGPPLVTLDTYTTANPGATLVNQTSGGGLRIVAGFGAGAWDNFVGNVDGVVVGTTEHETTFDFEIAGLATPIPTPTPTPTPSPTSGPDGLTPTPSPTNVALPDTAARGSDESLILLALVSLCAVISASAWRHHAKARQ